MGGGVRSRARGERGGGQVRERERGGGGRGPQTYIPLLGYVQIGYYPVSSSQSRQKQLRKQREENTLTPCKPESFT